MNEINVWQTYNREAELITQSAEVEKGKFENKKRSYDDEVPGMGNHLEIMKGQYVDYYV